MVAVLEVPDSPTKSTDLLILTICSTIQLALVVSTVGTREKKGDGHIQHICRMHFSSAPSSSQNQPLPRISANFISGL